LYGSFPEDISQGFPSGTDLLTRQVKGLVREKKESNLKCKTLEQQLIELKAQLTTSTQRYLVDSEQKKSVIETLDEKITNTDNTVKIISLRSLVWKDR
jgi:sugar-specific transcriptional regulator TrmB